MHLTAVGDLTVLKGFNAMAVCASLKCKQRFKNVEKAVNAIQQSTD